MGDADGVTERELGDAMDRPRRGRRARTGERARRVGESSDTVEKPSAAAHWGEAIWDSRSYNSGIKLGIAGLMELFFFDVRSSPPPACGSLDAV